MRLFVYVDFSVNCLRIFVLLRQFKIVFSSMVVKLLQSCKSVTWILVDSDMCVMVLTLISFDDLQFQVCLYFLFCKFDTCILTLSLSLTAKKGVRARSLAHTHLLRLLKNIGKIHILSDIKKDFIFKFSIKCSLCVCLCVCKLNWMVVEIYTV